MNYLRMYNNVMQKIEDDKKLATLLLRTHLEEARKHISGYRILGYYENILHNRSNELLMNAYLKELLGVNVNYEKVTEIGTETYAYEIYFSYQDKRYILSVPTININEHNWKYVHIDIRLLIIDSETEDCTSMSTVLKTHVVNDLTQYFSTK